MTFNEWYRKEVASIPFYYQDPEEVAELAWNKASELKQGEIAILQAQIATLQETIAAAQYAMAGAPNWSQGHRDAIVMLNQMRELINDRTQER